MSLSKWVLAAAGLAIVSASSGPAAAVPGVMLSGRVFNVAVCGHVRVKGVMNCNARVVTDAGGSVLEVKPNRGSVATPALAQTGAPPYGPDDLRAAYNIPAPGTTISGPTIAIVDAYGYPNAEADLAVYRQNYGLPPCTKANGCFRQVNQNGGTALPRFNLGWAQEQALDLDMVSAACPTCKILLVNANDAYTSNLAAAVNYAATQGVHAISNSYGGGESASYQSAFNHPGIAITASTGDYGWGAQFPATAPGVIAVGGTSLYHQPDGNGRAWKETAWADAGSGCSAIFPKLSWQAGVTDAACPNNRMEADVSAVADPNTGVAVYGPSTRTRNGWMQFGGTSASAPYIAGLYGRNNGAVNASQNIYNHRTALFDIVGGSNGTCTTYICNAVVGYDGPTGLGTPNGYSAFGN